MPSGDRISDAKASPELETQSRSKLAVLKLRVEEGGMRTEDRRCEEACASIGIARSLVSRERLIADRRVYLRERALTIDLSRDVIGKPVVFVPLRS
jgi:hypothetical protein